MPATEHRAYAGPGNAGSHHRRYADPPSNGRCSLPQRHVVQPAGNVFLLHAKNNEVEGTTTPFDPAGDGFVFTAAEIEQYLCRKTFAQDAYLANLKYQAAA